MVDFNKKLKIDRINLFCDVVTKMANGTPAEGYAIGDAIKQLPENLQQYLISEVPNSILRREYSRRELHKGDSAVFEGADVLTEVYKEEVFNANRAEALKVRYQIEVSRHSGRARRGTEMFSGTLHAR